MNGAQESQQDRNVQRRGSRRAIAARVVWGAILLPPLLCWAVLGMFAAFRHAPRVDTGDRLLDLFLQEMIDRDQIVGPRGAASSYYTNGTSGLPAEVFESWESEFAGDPRFWLLRSRYTTVDYATYMSDTYMSRPARIAVLNEAVKRGISAPALLARLISNNDIVWRTETYQLNSLDRPDYRTGTIEHWDDYIQERQLYADSRHATELNSLLDALLRSAPDQAMPLYYAANLAWRRGDMPAAFRLLREGNAAPKADGLADYPWDKIAPSASGTKISIDPVLFAGIGRSVSTSVALMDIGRMTDSMANYACKRGDLAALNALHVFLCRYAFTAPASASRIRAGTRNMKDAGDAFRASYSKNTTPAQKQALNELQAKISTLQSDAQALLQKTSIMPAKPTPYTLAWWRDIATNAATGGRSQAIRQLRQKWENAKLEQQGIEQKLRPEIAELLRFDYTKLSWK